MSIYKIKEKRKDLSSKEEKKTWGRIEQRDTERSRSDWHPPAHPTERKRRWMCMFKSARSVLLCSLGGGCVCARDPMALFSLHFFPSTTFSHRSRSRAYTEGGTQHQRFLFWHCRLSLCLMNQARDVWLQHSIMQQGEYAALRLRFHFTRLQNYFFYLKISFRYITKPFLI